MEKNKAFLLELLSKKGLALCEAFTRTLEETSDSGHSFKDQVIDVFNEIVKFAEPSDPKVKFYLTPMLFSIFKNP